MAGRKKERPRSEEPEAPAEQPRPATVLIADDDPIQRQILISRLTKLGYRVAVARNGSDALEQAKRSAPDAVVSDVMMPGLDGLQLCRALRQDTRLARIPIILTTSMNIAADAYERAQQAGASAFVPRTPGIREVLDALQVLLRERQMPLSNEPMSDVGEPLDHLQEPFGDLREKFRKIGAADSQRLLDSLETYFDQAAAQQLVHRWAGGGGTLGIPKVSSRAFQLERLLAKPIQEVREELRTGFQDMVGLFNENAPQEPIATGLAVPPPIQEALLGKRFALLGFTAPEAARLARAFEHVQAFARPVSPREAGPASPLLRGFDALVLDMSGGLEGSTWLGPGMPVTNDKPLLLVG